MWVAEVPAGIEAAATVSEPEGRCAVVARSDADQAGLAYDFVAAWIVLRVESALHAVGLTAAVSAALAGAGIACNVLAGLRHDHLLVPVSQADAALAVLGSLGTGASETNPRVNL